MAACDPERVREQLERILRSDVFLKKEKLGRFLTYVVNATLAGESDRIKQYSVGVDALGYDPGEESDAKVRAHAVRLRHALNDYYKGPGKTDLLRIELPKGQYVPVFSRTQARLAAARVRGYISVAAVLCVCAMAGAYVLRSRPALTEPFLRQLTFFEGDTQSPGPSRDGKLLAYSSDHGGEGGNDIWVRSMNSPEQDVRLTSHRADDTDPDVSPDNRWVVFRSMRGGGGVYIVAAAGGEERMLSDHGFFPRFSPDGKRVAYSGLEHSGNSSVYIVPVQGGEPTRVSAGLADAAGPVWSPDGKRLLVRGAVRKATGLREYDWWILAADSSAAPIRTHAAAALRLISGEMGGEYYPYDWAADNNVLLGFDKLVEVTLNSSGRAENDARVLYAGPGVYQARYRYDGAKRTVVFARRSFFPHIRELGMDLTAAKMTGESRKLTNDQSVLGVTSLSRDGTTLAYASLRSHSRRIFIKELPTGREVLFTSGDGDHTRPVLNPNGRRLAFFQQSPTSSSIRIVEIHSGETQTLCENCGELRDWSEDERRVLTVRGHSLLEVDADTRSRRTISEGDAYDFQEAAYSPDTRWIAAVVGIAGKPRLQGVVMPLQGGPASAWVPITEEPYDLALRWSPDGKLLYFFSRRDDFRCLWAQRVHPTTKEPEGAAFAVQHFHSPQQRVMGHGWASLGGSWLAVHSVRSHGNLFVLRRPSR
jgi:eukaryotic-like serine/threonine-protein kinase